MEAAFFDLDKTVIARASMVAFGRPLYRAGLISRWLVLRALYGQLVYLYLGADEARLARMRDSVLRLTKGWDHAHISSIVAETLEEVIEPIVYAEALDLIREHRDAGRRVFIISASPEEIVVPLAGYLGVHEALATRSRLDADGRYTGEVDLYCFGANKAELMIEIAARDGIDLAASWAYSDSATDLPMLEVVGHPVVVNPDRELLRAAVHRGWEVRTFVRKVRLRDRVSMPPPGPTAAVGGGLAALVAGVVVWWWLRQEDDPPPTWRERAVAQVRRRMIFGPERPSGVWGQRPQETRRSGHAAEDAERRPQTGLRWVRVRRRGPSWRPRRRGR